MGHLGCMLECIGGSRAPGLWGEGYLMANVVWMDSAGPGADQGNCTRSVSDSRCLSFLLGFIVNGVRGILRILNTADRFCSIALFTKLSHKNLSLASIEVLRLSCTPTRWGGSNLRVVAAFDRTPSLSYATTLRVWDVSAWD